LSHLANSTLEEEIGLVLGDLRDQFLDHGQPCLLLLDLLMDHQDHGPLLLMVPHLHPPLALLQDVVEDVENKNRLWLIFPIK